MTKRALLLGFCGVLFICGFSYFNDSVMHQTYLIGNNMPYSVYGILIIFVILINPLLFRLSKKLQLSRKEIAVILTITLASCCIPASGLLRSFTNSLMMPHQFNKTEPGWKEQNVVGAVPKQMLADISQNEDEALNGFIQGMGTPDNSISFSQIPWYAWKQTLMFWLPLILMLWISLMALSLVVHHQWADHENLPYPIATFTNSLFPAAGQQTSSLLSKKMFWLGAGIVFAIHMNNYAHTWFPRVLLRIPTKLDFTSLLSYFKTFGRGGGWNLMQLKVFFSVIGIAYFLTTDVSLSLGIGPLLYTAGAGILIGYGISPGGTLEGKGWYLVLKIQTFLQAGAYIGVFLSILYAGRYYYRAVFSKALFLPAAEKVEKHVVWSARIFIITLAVFILQMNLAGLDWQLSALYAIIIVILFLVMGRIIAETGVFYMQPYFFPCVLIWGIFGINALGSRTMLIMFIITMVLLVDPP